MYYGGKGVLHSNDKIQTISIESVFRNMTCYLKEKYKANHYKEHLTKFSRQTDIALNKNGFLDVTVTDNPTELAGANKYVQNGGKSPSTIIYKSLYRKDNGEIFPTRYYCINLIDSSNTSKSSVSKNVLKNHDIYRSYVLKEIDRKCQLFREFDSGGIKLSHDELFGIATNLIHVEAGSQRIRDVLSKHSHFYGDKFDKWVYDLAYMKQLDYRPQGCDSFCPHQNKCVHNTNVLSTARPKRGIMERIPDYSEKYIPIKDVENDVYHATHEAYRSNDNNWHIIKAMTGAGKTTTYLKLMSKNSSDRFLIAAPTNILKNEIYDKAFKMGLNISKTPSLEEIKETIPRKVYNHIQQLYKTGQHQSVHPYICEMLKKKDIPCLREYVIEFLEQNAKRASNC